MAVPRPGRVVRGSATGRPLMAALDLLGDAPFFVVNGDAFWLDERAWKDFYQYEMELNSSMAGQPMSVLCAYPLAVTGAADIFDVARAPVRGRKAKSGLGSRRNASAEAGQGRDSKAQ